MNNVPTTKHARTRLQQRAIPPMVVDLLQQFGATEPAGKGATKYFFDKVGRRRVLAYVGTMAKAVEPLLDTYAVISSDARVITACHRIERIHRH